jgi:hypothetical protein
MKLTLWYFLVPFLLDPATFAQAAEPSAGITPPMVLEEIPPPPAAKGAPVLLDGRTLFYLQALLSGR